jgi:hypothetical protein
MPINARNRNDKSDLRQALDKHLRDLPADALLLRVIASPGIEEKLAAFDRADAIAIRKRKSYRRFGAFALWAMMTGAIIGALVLLPIEFWSKGWPRRMIEAVQALALVLTFLAVMWIGVRQSVGLWMQARAEAEAIRAEVFRAIVRAGADAKELLPQVLACFKDAHLDWQLAYFERRSDEHRRSAGRVTPFRVVAYLLSAASVLLGCVGLINLASEFGFSWPPLRTAAQWFQPEESGRWQLGLGAIASSVLAFASARTFMDQDDRNASCYKATAAQLQRIAREEFPTAGAAALAGQVGTAMAFCERVQTILSAEHLAWSFARPPDDPRAVPDPLA